MHTTHPFLHKTHTIDRFAKLFRQSVINHHGLRIDPFLVIGIDTDWNAKLPGVFQLICHPIADRASENPNLIADLHQFHTQRNAENPLFRIGIIQKLWKHQMGHDWAISTVCSEPSMAFRFFNITFHISTIRRTDKHFSHFHSPLPFCFIRGCSRVLVRSELRDNAVQDFEIVTFQSRSQFFQKRRLFRGECFTVLVVPIHHLHASTVAATHCLYGI
nr:MAG TPA: hypothetical protein [Caudoviricetes sp.]